MAQEVNGIAVVKVGDVVVLNAVTPRDAKEMTVIGLRDDGRVLCAWHDSHGQLCEKSLPLKALKVWRRFDEMGLA
jgi:uncharacterized protein YodC (DUF2158 family)